MGILIVSAVFPPEPVVSASISQQLAAKLAENLNVDVLCPVPSRPHGSGYVNYESYTYPYKVHHAESYVCSKSSFIGRMRESISFGRVTQKHIYAHKGSIDLIYANTWPVFAQYFLIKAAVKCKIPVILHIQDVYPESMLKRLGKSGKFFKSILVSIDKHFLKQTQKIIAISDLMKDYISHTRRILPESICVVRNWQDEKQFIDVQDITHPDSDVFMFLGSLSPAAGVDVILKAFHVAQLKDAKLIIAGSGSCEEEYKKLVQELSIKHVEFTKVDAKDVPALQAQADFLILPLKRGVSMTATPSKLAAYMFSAKPIIASVDKHSDVEDIIYKANCGVVAEPDDINSISAHLIALQKFTQAKRMQLGLNGRNYAMNYMSSKNLDLLVNTILNYLDYDSKNSER